MSVTQDLSLVYISLTLVEPPLLHSPAPHAPPPLTPRPGRPGRPLLARSHQRMAATPQGLTLVHFSAQPKPCRSHLFLSPCLIDWGEMMHPTLPAKCA